MLNKFLLAAVLLSVCAHASEVWFRIDGKKQVFFDLPERHLTLSARCRTTRKMPEFRCEAFEALSRASLLPLAKLLKGGKNPGAVICREQLHATVVVGTDAKGNSNSFCRFTDGSLVDCGTLVHYARTNDAR